MFHNKSQEEPRLKRCSSSTGHFILASLLFCLRSPAVTSSGLLFVSSCHGCVLLPIPLVTTTCTFKIAQRCNTVIDSKSSKWGRWKKGHWAFLDSSSKAQLCVYRLRKGLGSGTWSLQSFTTLSCLSFDSGMPYSPCSSSSSSACFSAQQTDPVIFSIWKILGVTGVSAAAEARSGFSYKQVHRLYLNRQWHLTPKHLWDSVSGQACHKSLEGIK